MFGRTWQGKRVQEPVQLVVAFHFPANLFSIQITKQSYGRVSRGPILKQSNSENVQMFMKSNYISNTQGLCKYSTGNVLFKNPSPSVFVYYVP